MQHIEPKYAREGDDEDYAAMAARPRPDVDDEEAGPYAEGVAAFRRRLADTTFDPATEQTELAPEGEIEEYRKLQPGKRIFIGYPKEVSFTRVKAAIDGSVFGMDLSKMYPEHAVIAPGEFYVREGYGARERGLRAWLVFPLGRTPGSCISVCLNEDTGKSELQKYQYNLADPRNLPAKAERVPVWADVPRRVGDPLVCINDHGVGFICTNEITGDIVAASLLAEPAVAPQQLRLPTVEGGVKPHKFLMASNYPKFATLRVFWGKVWLTIHSVTTDLEVSREFSLELSQHFTNTSEGLPEYAFDIDSYGNAIVSVVCQGPGRERVCHVYGVSSVRSTVFPISELGGFNIDWISIGTGGKVVVSGWGSERETVGELVAESLLNALGRTGVIHNRFEKIEYSDDDDDE